MSIRENDSKDLKPFLEHSIYLINIGFRVSDYRVKTKYMGLLNHTSDISWVPALCQTLCQAQCWVKRNKAHHLLRQFMAQSRESANCSPGAQSHPGPIFVRVVLRADWVVPAELGDTQTLFCPLQKKSANPLSWALPVCMALDHSEGQRWRSKISAPIRASEPEPAF